MRYLADLEVGPFPKSFWFSCISINFTLRKQLYCLQPLLGIRVNLACAQPPDSPSLLVLRLSGIPCCQKIYPNHLYLCKIYYF